MRIVLNMEQSIIKFFLPRTLANSVIHVSLPKYFFSFLMTHTCKKLKAKRQMQRGLSYFQTIAFTEIWSENSKLKKKNRNDTQKRLLLKSLHYFTCLFKINIIAKGPPIKFVTKFSTNLYLLPIYNAFHQLIICFLTLDKNALNARPSLNNLK